MNLDQLVIPHEENERRREIKVIPSLWINHLSTQMIRLNVLTLVLTPPQNVAHTPMHRLGQPADIVHVYYPIRGQYG